MVSARPKRSGRKPIKARVEVRLQVDGRCVFGFGLSQILEAVGTSGSIKAAAKSIGKSYRHVWGRIKEAEEAWGEQLVRTRVGGQGTSRSSLTDQAAQLLTDYAAMRSRVIEVVQEKFPTPFEVS